MSGDVKHLTIWTAGHRAVGRNGRPVYRFVERCDFVTSLGRRSAEGKTRKELGLQGDGPDAVITELGIFDYDEQTDRMRLKALYPDTTTEDVVNNTGFEVIIPPKVGTVPMPSWEHVQLMRRLDPLRMHEKNSLRKTGGEPFWWRNEPWHIDGCGLQAPKWLLLGASNQPGKMGYVFVQNLLTGYDGAIYPIHPTEDEILGIRAFRSVAEAPRPIDLAVVMTPRYGAGTCRRMWASRCPRGGGDHVRLCGDWGGGSQVTGRNRDPGASVRAAVDRTELLWHPKLPQ